jgi:hypothetical protein
LWSSWIKAGHANPDFGTDKAYFYDENRKLRYILFNDLRDETKLGYRYSTLMSPLTPMARLEQFEALSAEAHIPFNARAMTKKTSERFLIIRNIHNLEKLPETRTFGIFADNPAPGTLSTADPGFLGTVATILSEEHHEETGPLTAALDVSAKLPKLTGHNKNALDLIVVALDANGKTTGKSIPLSAESISLIE